MVENKYTK